MTKRSLDYLFYHLLDGFKTTHEGLNSIRNQGAITVQEHHDLITKNSERLIRLIQEFKLVNRILSIFFVGLFIHLQVSGGNNDLRMARRLRTRRRYETEIIDVQA